MGSASSAPDSLAAGPVLSLSTHIPQRNVAVFVSGDGAGWPDFVIEASERGRRSGPRRRIPSAANARTDCLTGKASAARLVEGFSAQDFGIKNLASFEIFDSQLLSAKLHDTSIHIHYLTPSRQTKA
jgi:hypothetical protein